jgi:serine/threonine protein kinase
MKIWILKGDDYDYSVDIWSLGILLYELCSGYAPFERKPQNDVFKSIVQVNNIIIIFALNNNVSIKIF